MPSGPEAALREAEDALERRRSQEPKPEEAGETLCGDMPLNAKQAQLLQTSRDSHELTCRHRLLCPSEFLSLGPQVTPGLTRLQISNDIRFQNIHLSTRALSGVHGKRFIGMRTCPNLPTFAAAAHTLGPT